MSVLGNAFRAGPRARELRRARTAWSRIAGGRLGSVAALACLALAACSHTPPAGYGLMTPAAAPAPAADDQPVPESRDQYLSLIARMQTEGLWYASLAHLESCEQRWGSDARSRLMRADALRNVDDLDGAERLYRELTNDAAQSARAWRGLGLVAGARGNYADAARWLEEARRRDPIDPSILGDLAYARLAAGDPAGARLPMLQALQLAPADERLQLNFALLLAVSGDTAAADRWLAEHHVDADRRAAVFGEAQRLAAQRAATSGGSTGADAGPGAMRGQQPGTAPSGTAPPSESAAHGGVPAAAGAAAFAGVPGDSPASGIADAKAQPAAAASSAAALRFSSGLAVRRVTPRPAATLAPGVPGGAVAADAAPPAPTAASPSGPTTGGDAAIPVPVGPLADASAAASPSAAPVALPEPAGASAPRPSEAPVAAAAGSSFPVKDPTP